MAKKGLFSKISVGVVARIGPFLKSMRKLRKRLKGVRERLVKLSKYATAFSGAAVAGMAALIRSSLSSVDALAKTADKLGLTTEKLQAYRHAAELSGVSGETFSTALQRMTRRLSEVGSTGKGTAAPALEELGLKIENLKNLSPDQQFAMIADAMNNVSSQGDRVRLAFALFDTEGVGLVNMLRMGSKGLREIEKEFTGTGLAISRFDAAKIEMANDSIARMKALLIAVCDKVTAEVAPLITTVSDRLRTATDNGVDFGDAIKEKFVEILEYADPVLRVFNMIAGVWSGIRGIISTVLGGILKGVQGITDGISWMLKQFGVEWKAEFSGLLGDAMIDEGMESFEKVGERWGKAFDLNADLGIDQLKRDLENIDKKANEIANKAKNTNTNNNAIPDPVKKQDTSPRFASLALRGTEAAWKIMRGNGDDKNAKQLKESQYHSVLLKSAIDFLRRINNGIQYEGIDL